MIASTDTKDRFLSDVSDHQMQVIRDDGVNRHIRFKRPDSGCYYFDLITWPGHLCYTGDMGTYVFQRTTDMFEFFRQNREYHASRGNPLAINLRYWTEKLIATGGKVKEFDEDKFKRVINGYRVQWMRDAKESGSLNKEERRELWEAVDDEVFLVLEDGDDRAQYAAYDFHYRVHPGDQAWSFEDLFENDFTEYTHGIVWCCYALAWGIEKYDASKIEQVAA